MYERSVGIGLYNLRPHGNGQGFTIARKGVGSVIGRRSVRGGREYQQIWVYIPAKVAEDSAFQLKPADPVEIEIDPSGRLIVTPISVEKARELGWAKRERNR